MSTCKPAEILSYSRSVYHSMKANVNIFFTFGHVHSSKPLKLKVTFVKARYLFSWSMVGISGIEFQFCQCTSRQIL